jgi:peptide deformylase
MSPNRPIPQLLIIVAGAAALPPAAALLHYQKLPVQRQPGACAAARRSSGTNLSMRLNPTSFPGTDLTITEFPRPALRRPSQTPVVDFDEAFQSKADELLGIMYEAKGVGLAAPQVGLNENFFVYNPFDRPDLARVVCNPTITAYSPDVTVEVEGCLSLRSDECAGQVARAVWIETEYQNQEGQKVRRRLKDFEARVFQHEYDHLRGILCYDRFPPEDREAVQKSIETLLGLYAEDDARVEPDADAAGAMQPRPLSAKRMPPLGDDATELEDGNDKKVKANKKRKGTKPKSGGFGAKSSGGGGFGAGGGGGGGGGGDSSGTKKETKKKVKARNALRSSDPRFKSTGGKTPFASRK